MNYGHSEETSICPGIAHGYCMATCKSCGKVLPPPPRVLDRYTPRGLLWLIIVVVTVGGWAITMALNMVTYLLENKFPYGWRLALLGAFGVVIIMMIASSILRTLKARRLKQYCSECATAMGTKGLSHPEEFGAHKLRMMKG